MDAIATQTVRTSSEVFAELHPLRDRFRKIHADVESDRARIGELEGALELARIETEPLAVEFHGLHGQLAALEEEYDAALDAEIAAMPDPEDDDEAAQSASA